MCVLDAMFSISRMLLVNWLVSVQVCVCEGLCVRMRRQGNVMYSSVQPLFAPVRSESV